MERVGFCLRRERPLEIAQVIGRVSKDWSSLTSKLRAPDGLMVSKLVANGMGWRFSRLSKFPEPYACKRVSGKPGSVDLARLMFSQLLPAEVEFAGVGSFNSPGGFGLEVFRDIAAKLVKLGYQGELCFVSAYYQQEIGQPLESITVRIPILDGQIRNDFLDPHVVICWEPEFGGSEKNVAAVLNACTNQGLRRYHIV